MQNDLVHAFRPSVRRQLSMPAIEWTCYLIGVALLGSGLVHLVAAAADPRAWLGPLSWRKPVTFGLSFGSVLIAVTWVTSYLRLSARARTVLLGVFAADCVVEVAGITVQAWRDVPSHFNNTTAFNAAIAYSLAVGGAVLVVVLSALASVAIRGRTDAAPSMRLALRAGFALLLVGLAAGVAMIARGEVLIKQGHRTAAYDSAGFLKWTHAITLHAVLVLPALAWWLARTPRDEAQRVRIVAVASWCYVVAAAGSVVIALALSF
jgi:hypothetical protein